MTPQAKTRGGPRDRSLVMTVWAVRPLRRPADCTIAALSGRCACKYLTPLPSQAGWLPHSQMAGEVEERGRRGCPVSIPKTCERCGQQYEALLTWQRWCPGCRSWGRRERKRLWQQVWRKQRYSRPCPCCGKTRYEVTGKRLCSQCRGLQKRRGALRRCYWCGAAVYRSPSALRAARSWCDRCQGSVSAYAREVGLSRQRVHQLVAREMQRLQAAGGSPTRAEALARVRAQRRSA
jgi:hypothetical protein